MHFYIRIERVVSVQNDDSMHFYDRTVSAESAFDHHFMHFYSRKAMSALRFSAFLRRTVRAEMSLHACFYDHIAD